MEYFVKKGSRMHRNACKITDTKHAFPEHVSASGICAICAKEGLCEIGKRAKTGQTLFPEPFGLQFGAEKKLSCLDDIQIIPQLFGPSIIFREVDTSTELGGFEVELPIAVAAMGSTKTAHVHGAALAEGAAKAGIPIVIGENMLATHKKEGLKARIKPYLDNYSDKGGLIVQGNVIDQKMKIFETAVEMGAHAIEVKLGQGAKQGLGGEIKFEGENVAREYEKYGYTIIKNPDGSFQRHTPPGELSEDMLRETLVKYKELDVPIWIKIAMGRGIYKLIELLNKIKKEEKVQIVALTVDGHGGGTGMSPWLIMNESCLPSPALFAKEFKADFDILLAGGFASGLDIGKGIMLGSDGVSLGRAFLIATNVAKANGVVNLVRAYKEELQMLAATQRVSALVEIKGKRKNLFALSQEAAQLFGLPLCPTL